MLNDSNISRFFDKVNFTSTCWLWIGGKSSFGHGRFRVGEKLYSPHRLAYEFFYESIPENKHICHHCDNPSCVRPDHLFLGSHAQNMADMVSKNRHAHGSKSGGAKLCELDVWLIRQLRHIKNREVARFFSISESIVSQIHSRQIWKHV